MLPTPSWTMRLVLLCAVRSALVIAADEKNIVAIEEAAVLPNGFSPRLFDAAFRIPPPFAKRQDAASCPGDYHSCAEIGAADKCCPSTQYCAYGDNWEVKCCGFGLACDAVCTSTSYRTNATTIYTTNIPLSTGGSDTGSGTDVLIETTITSPFVGCVARVCDVTAYQCPSSMGGGCCDNTERCASSRRCIGDVTSSETPLVPTRGCSGTPSATACATDGGCCLQGQTCVASGAALYCAGTADPPAGANVTSTSTGLSQGARAGIGAGVAIGAAIVIGALTWFCIRRRREASRTAGSRSRGPTPGPEGITIGSGGIAGGAGGGAARGGAGMGGDMSEASGPSRGRRAQTGLAYEYLGPNAVHGPYTQHEDTPGATPSLRDRGVVGYPQDPNDIQVPVEIGSSSDKPLRPSMTRRDKSTVSAGTTAASMGMRTAEPPEEKGEIYELAAFQEPSPLSPDDFQSAHSHPIGSPGAISPQGATMKTDYLG